MPSTKSLHIKGDGVVVFLFQVLIYHYIMNRADPTMHSAAIIVADVYVFPIKGATWPSGNTYTRSFA